MTDLGGNLAILLQRELAGFERELGLFPDDESVWRTAPGLPNAAGNLALHVAGNLQHYVGTVLGRSGYVRNRELEFGRRSGPRGDVLAELRAASRTVESVLPNLPPERFEGGFPEPVDGLGIPTDRFLMHLCSHAAFHLGQAGYVRRAVTGDARSSRPVPLQALTSEPPSNHVEEAIGVARAAQQAGMPAVISFTVETDGRLPTGQSLRDAIEGTDAATGSSPAYYMINCAHPAHFEGVLKPGEPWVERVRGLRANASIKSHAELNESSELDAGDPADLGADHARLKRKLPRINVLGGCCGTDERHVEQMALACAPFFR